ncbi:histidine--tRNA ligase [Peribacillus simplex]|uniref:histidine--tRNA ligase n=1 Tax=Peribacillus simplex TaxID=1478 RepID=UPI000F63A983|nr:histidine--tRNA ligase [Peribacillus simplex]RRN74329.1 histidine--tRNA ligase [Peribacillus simplex]
MKKMAYQNVKGTQDYLPQDEEIRHEVKRALEEVFLLYGCRPIETPILNHAGLLASKYGGGAEILKEMYTLTDQGKRKLALRYDLTIPFAKVIAMNPGIRKPFKRYEIGKVFRDGPIKAGRFREFTQCDVDVVGVESQAAEAELMMMATEVFEKLKLDVRLEYNNRKLLAGMLEVLGVPRSEIAEVTLTLDKLEKISIKGVSQELAGKRVNKATIQAIEGWLNEAETIDLNYFKKVKATNITLQEGLKELSELKGLVDYLQLGDICIFNPFLARGLEIYSGTVYEIFLADGELKSSIGSGGRYDNAIGGLAGTNDIVSTVGISFGLDVILTVLKGEKTKVISAADYYIIPIGMEKEALSVAKKYRQKGFKVEVELSGKKVNKALERANKEGIQAVMIIGENEVKANLIKIKDMKTGGETSIPFIF